MKTDYDEGPIDYEDLGQTLLQAKGDTELFNLIVNAPFENYKIQTTFLFLGIIVLLLVDKKTGIIKRIALSDTDLARRTTDVSVIPFNKIEINLNEPKNIIAMAIREGKPQDTTDWESLFLPALTPEQSRINQASAGIAYSAVYPLKARDGGALIFSFYQYRELIGSVQEDFMTKYSGFVAKRLNIK